jgi:hypothetical protein
MGSQAEEAWVHDRCRLAAAMIDGSANVADLGCGMQVLRAHLPPSTPYTGYDLGTMHPDNVHLDLDAPFRLDEAHTTAVLLGVLEYLDDPVQALASARATVGTLVASFVCAHNASDDDLARRVGLGVKHHWSVEDLERIASNLRLVEVERQVVWERPGERHLVLRLNAEG